MIATWDCICTLYHSCRLHCKGAQATVKRTSWSQRRAEQGLSRQVSRGACAHTGVRQKPWESEPLAHKSAWLRQDKGTQTQFFWVRVSSDGVGLPREGVGPKNSVCPSKPRETKFFVRISRDFAGISRGARQVWEKHIWVQFWAPIESSFFPLEMAFSYHEMKGLRRRSLAGLRETFLC